MVCGIVSMEPYGWKVLARTLNHPETTETGSFATGVAKYLMRGDSLWFEGSLNVRNLTERLFVKGSWLAA